MKRIALAAVAAAAAAVGLTACTNSAAPAAAPAAHSTAVPVVQASCSQQYHTWGQGKGKGVIAAITTASVASTAKNPGTLKAELQKVKPAVTKAARYPLPGCADPRGYWPVLLMHMTAAVSSTGTTASARAAMKGVPVIAHELTAELHAVVGTA